MLFCLCFIDDKQNANKNKEIIEWKIVFAKGARNL